MVSSLFLEKIDLEKLERIAHFFSTLFSQGDVVLLDGDLGAGKTTFTQLLAKHLNVKDNQYVSSPSYSLLHQYDADMPIFHMDLYRLTDEDDIEHAGLAEYIGASGLCIIEWPERLGTLTPPECLAITLHNENPETRNIEVKLNGKRWIDELEKINHFCLKHQI